MLGLARRNTEGLLLPVRVAPESRSPGHADESIADAGRDETGRGSCGPFNIYKLKYMQKALIKANYFYIYISDKSARLAVSPGKIEFAFARLRRDAVRR